MSVQKRTLLFTLLFMVFFLLTAASAFASPTGKRLMGDDRYQTAVAISQAGWPNGASTAILTTGDNFPDALSAAPLAHKYDAPILLTGSGDLDSNTKTELIRLNVKNVLIIGGDGVISGTVDNELKQMGIGTKRYAGLDRYDTALKVAQDVGIKQGVFVTTGLDFPDALSIAPIAAAQGMPILLVPRDNLTPELQAFLGKNKIPHTYIINGSGEISDSVVNLFPNREILGGNDLFERNINVIRRFADKINFDSLYFATGKDFPDALAAAALAQKEQSAIILLDNSGIPDPVKTFLPQKVVGHINVLGGESVINGTTESGLCALPAQVQSIGNINITISEGQKYNLPDTVNAVLTNGLKQDLPVTWVLSSFSTAKPENYYYHGTTPGDGSVSLVLTVQPVVAKVNNITAEMVLGDNFVFPPYVTAIMSDNTVKHYLVTWNNLNANINKAGSYTFQGIISGLNQKVSLTLKVSNDSAITFKDPKLEQVVRNKVGKTDNQPIYKSDVLKIINLDVSGQGITDLTGLETFTNLTYLNLDNNNLTGSKLAPLQKLVNLMTLILSNNTGINNISSLRSLTTLEYLDLRNDTISDYTTLSSLTSLYALYLGGNPGKNYVPTKAYYDNLTSKDFSLK